MLREVPLTTDELVAGITERAKGLTFISETDAPVEVARIGTENQYQEPFDADMFRVAVGARRSTKITEREFDNFFDTQSDNDERWLELKNYLDAYIQPAHVWKVGGVQSTIYVVGIYNGVLVGIKVYAVET